MGPPNKRRKKAQGPAKKGQVDPARVKRPTKRAPAKKRVSSKTVDETEDAPKVPLRRNPKRGAAARERASKLEVPWLGRGLSVVQDPWDPRKDQPLWTMPTPPSNVGANSWPDIRYGDDAPTPRWRVTLDDADPATGNDLALDVIKVRIGQSIINGVGPHDHPRSYDSGFGLGGLVWAFDPGPEKDWCGLTETQLYEFAYRSLEEALKDATCREQFRIAIREGKYQDAVFNVEDPLPPLPPTPETNHLGPGTGLRFLLDRETKIGAASFTFPRSYKRPSMTVLRGEQHPMVKQMFLHRKGTLGPPGEISPSIPDRPRQPGQTVATKSKLSKEHVLRGKTSNAGEYKFF